MSDEEITRLLDMLDEGDVKARLRALRRLAALGDPRAIPQVSNVYNNPDEDPTVIQEAVKTLGVYKAIQEALDRQEDVRLPEADEVKEPRFSPEFLRRLLRILSILMVILWLVNALLFLMPKPPSSGVDELNQVQALAAQYDTLVQNQFTAWQPVELGGSPNCDVARQDPPEVPDLEINAEEFPHLRQANIALRESQTQLVLAINNLKLFCDFNGEVTPSMLFVDGASQALAEAQEQLSLAQANIAVPPTVDSATTPADSVATSAPEVPTEIPSPVATATPPIDPVVYRSYLTEIRNRIDDLTAARGPVDLLTTFWNDVQLSGQTGGCGFLFDPSQLEDHVLPLEDLEAEPRLQSLVSMLNLGLDLTRSSLADFQQGCANGTLSQTIQVGLPRIEAASNSFGQASQLVDQLRAELQP